MPRPPRSAPIRDYKPLDEFSSWDIRIAKCIYYGYLISTVVTVFGIWGSIIGAIPIEQWEVYMALPPGIQIAIVVGTITAHLFVVVLFYSLYRGGTTRMCKIIFKDRLVAKKWEDYWTLRMLVAVTLVGAYVTIIALILGLLPLAFFKSIAALFEWMVANFNFGNWALYVGLVMLLGVAIVFFGFVLWNHGVYAVLKRVKTIEEQDEVKDRIKTEELTNADETTRRKEYTKETGKPALYRGKETQGYMEWKKKKIGS